MPQNIYDTQDFFDGYSQLNRSVHGLAGAPEWASLQAMLPDLDALKVVDLGCGFGWFCRWAREHGAQQVLGIDVSEKMLARAMASTSDPAIIYRRADLEHLTLDEAGFDLAYSSLTFHYLVDLAGMLKMLHRALVPGGKLVFSIEHPILMASLRARWTKDEDGRKIWPVDNYQLEGPRVTNWLADGVIKQHRTMGTLLNLLIKTGFTIDHVEEWGPSETQIALQPELAQEKERPMLLLLAAHR